MTTADRIPRLRARLDVLVEDTRDLPRLAAEDASAGRLPWASAAGLDTACSHLRLGLLALLRASDDAAAAPVPGSETAEADRLLAAYRAQRGDAPA